MSWYNPTTWRRAQQDPTPLWEHAGHELVATEVTQTGIPTHVYACRFRRGLEERTVLYRFHAQDPGKGKDDAKLITYFRAQADLLNGRD